MDETDLTIAGIAASDPAFSILVTALEAAELTGALDMAEDDLTVFAPTNAAFVTLAQELGFDGDAEDPEAVFAFIAAALADLDEGGDPIPALTDILLYHVSPGAKSADEIGGAETVETLLSETAITPTDGRLVDLEPDLLDPEIAVPDIAASNGVVHVIDRVLLPLDVPGNDRDTITGIAAGNPDFEVLTLALEAAGLADTLDDPNGEFTVFAPTDAALANIAALAGYEGDPEDAQGVFDAIAGYLASFDPDGDPIPLLTAVLLYHVVPGAQEIAALTDLPSVGTLAGGLPIILTADGTIIDNDPLAIDPALVEGLTDIAASNGFVNAIDQVLLPTQLVIDPTEPEDTIADIVAASGDELDDNPDDFDILLAALGAAGLVEALSQPEDAFTVFAPTDAAFLSLAEQLGADASSEQAALDGILGALSGLSAEGDPVPLLTSILLYHVVDGEFGRVALATGVELTTLFGPAPATDGAGLVDADGGFADASFIDAASEILAANGFVHAIDEVLLPINVPDATDVIGTEGDDTLTVAEDTLTVQGGTGEDAAVFSGEVADTAFGYIDGGFSATTGESTVELFGVESFVFDDETVLVDTGDLSAQVFRLYGVGLGREGDIAGVTFWTGEAEDRGLGAVADAVLVSDEFADLFGGEVPGDDEIVEALYGNFLDREADEAGLAFWNEQVSSGALDTSDLLLAFSESDEFGALTENQTDDGVLLFA